MSARSRCVPSRRDPHRAASETGRWGAGGGAELIRSHGEGLCPAPRSQAVPKPPWRNASHGGSDAGRVPGRTRWAWFGGAVVETSPAPLLSGDDVGTRAACACVCALPLKLGNGDG